MCHRSRNVSDVHSRHLELARLSGVRGPEMFLTITRQSPKFLKCLLIHLEAQFILMKSNTMRSIGLGSHEAVVVGSVPSG